VEKRVPKGDPKKAYFDPWRKKRIWAQKVVYNTTFFAFFHHFSRKNHLFSQNQTYFQKKIPFKTNSKPNFNPFLKKKCTGESKKSIQNHQNRQKNHFPSKSLPSYVFSKESKKTQKRVKTEPSFCLPNTILYHSTHYYQYHTQYTKSDQLYTITHSGRVSGHTVHHIVHIYVQDCTQYRHSGRQLYRTVHNTVQDWTQYRHSGRQLYRIVHNPVQDTVQNAPHTHPQNRHLNK